MTALTPDRIMDVGMAFWPAKTLLSAVELGLFTVLGDGGFDFTGADFSGWCAEAGFRELEVIPLRGPASAAVAYK
jgi:hypothetical protein